MLELWEMKLVVMWKASPECQLVLFAIRSEMAGPAHRKKNRATLSEFQDYTALFSYRPVHQGRYSPNAFITVYQVFAFSALDGINAASPPCCVPLIRDS